MLGMMMDVPLLVPSILRHAARWHADTEIVSRDAEGAIHRTSYAALWARCHRLANALERLGLRPGDRVGTLAWNGHRHLELYYGVGGAGMVCHTINPRLFPEQIGFIVEDAADSVLCVDPGLVPLLEGIAKHLGGVRAIVVLTEAARMPRSDILPGLLCYETLLEAEGEDYEWPALDENGACGLCYTSGTTGNPKGVLYSHRSTVLHAMSVGLPDVFGLSATSVVMPVVPMFHVNAWGLPYAVPLTGGKLVLPGPKLDGASLHALIVEEGVTFTAGVPTVWMGLLDWVRANGKDIAPLGRVVIGGSACPPVMIERFAALGAEVRHAWGMTETSPLGAVSVPKAGQGALTPEARLALSTKQGRPFFGIDLRAVDSEGRDVPWDGATYGALLARGPWVCAGYLGLAESPAHARAGWFETGDVVTIDPDGFVQIVDRTKDVIKSGGEWISSIDLENIAVAHPEVQEAAAVARPDARWGERPLLVVVPRPGASPDPAAIRAFFEGKVAKWCIPDEVRVVESLPHTATGKLLKSRIREMLG
ncbi:long-chain-fatty-acid--CoA ligase [Roseomonas sp. NAR14]|uniref:3-methylmercaptopropionyl-CoA ligase n=1 Tax=Roseomonas acroporae TaxID=2937791 RepID=A0A9X1Y340_9PROT|nr:long-chain-fatty-acid--CoA ligase [Roseomonas acroporae]MCK8783274.1 long-chain-fatty-acid--CoA ligase [Roseomonas acroporae]